MVKINFNGYIRGKDRKVVREAINFFMSDQLPGRKGESTHLEVRFISLPKSVHGVCSVHDEETNSYAPRMFSIDVSGKLSLKKTVETIAHEMVHLRQFRNKELRYRQNYTSFNGKAYSHDLPYEKEPWEKEAYKLESVLSDAFWAYFVAKTQQ